ncbi:TetR/AcrR family transcriptional regulator [Mycobacterium cookii]|uniref:TetR family transcriptional regulator n=2 Tax=Mycobacterium cookii TaxID=1775 RepID=A0A7I7KVK5_9MYCO|nr:TetR-like C-terminal domain-containing protein [Mycobacterium cookii]MCV7331422.1 TetR/AcrR family transcriptional regulator [Mycobacterium cookii]BBX45776.1 TetR family transcriptional regulator [Mycobacterium cookii]
MAFVVSEIPDTEGAGGYHHGHLRDTLLRYGIELARSGGPEAVSIRAVQRLARVSNAAAYRHYADRYALLQAISDHASRCMADAMTDAIDAAGEGDTPADAARARFRASGAAYLNFALTEPGLFAIAFLTDLPSKDPANPRPGARNAAGLGPFQLLQRCVDELEATGALSTETKPFTDIAAWSAVHGLAVLINHGPLAQLPQAARHSAINRLLQIIEDGLETAARHGDSVAPPTSPGGRQTRAGR